jgi:dCTP deaminase
VSVIPLTIQGPDQTVVEDEEHFDLEGRSVLIQNIDRAQLTENDEDSNVTYDLRIGTQCRNHLGTNINDIPIDGIVTLPPGSAFIIQTEEYLHLPRRMFGTIAPRVSLLQRGLSTTFSKVDPGYPGHLLVTLFNLGKSTVTLKRGERFCALTLYDVAPGARLYRKGPKQITAPPAKQPSRSLRDWLTHHQVPISAVGIVVTLIVIIEQLIIFIWSTHHTK